MLVKDTARAGKPALRRWADGASRLKPSISTRCVSTAGRCYDRRTMNITITPFDRERHLDIAAALLAGRHRRDRTREQLLPATFDDAKLCREQIEHAFESEGWYGV